MMISPMISLMVAFMSPTFDCRGSSLMVARDVVHKPEYAALLSLSFRQSGSSFGRDYPGTHHKTSLQR